MASDRAQPSWTLRFFGAFCASLGGEAMFGLGIQKVYGLPADLSAADTLVGLLGAIPVAVVSFLAGWVLLGHVQASRNG